MNHHNYHVMKKFSKITSILASALVAVALTACGGQKNSGTAETENKETTELTASQQKELQAFQKELEAVNQHLPMKTADGLTLTKMELTDGYMITTCTYPQGDELEIENTPEAKATVLQAAGEATIKHLKDLNIGLKYVYIEEGTDNSMEISISPEEM